MVGAGNISEFHIHAVRAVPGLVDLVGVTDLDQARAEATAQKFGTKTFLPSLDALVDAGANVIHVLTPAVRPRSRRARPRSSVAAMS